MEQIIRIYGRFLLTAVVFVSFWIFVLWGMRDEHGNIGFFQMMGEYFADEQVAYGADFTTCIEETQRQPPIIFYKKNSALLTGSYNVEELIGATDCEGRNLPIKVRKSFNAKGMQDMQIYDKDSGQIYFSTPGIYTLQISAMDSWNRVSVQKISIPVNKMGGWE